MFPVLRNPSTMTPWTAGPVNRLDSLFDTVFGNDGGTTGQLWASVPLAVWEDEDHVFVEAEMPGVSEQDVDLTVHKGTLLIRGESKPAEGRKFLYNGRSFGRFERIINLPEEVSADDVQASLNQGVLSIVLRKSPESKPRKITLKST